MSDDTTYDYGYDRPFVIYFFIFSFVPIIMYETKIRFPAYYILVIIIGLVIIAGTYRLYLAIYAVEIGIGSYFALIGGFLQLLGIFSIIIIEGIKKMKMRSLPN